MSDKTIDRTTCPSDRRSFGHGPTDARRLGAGLGLRCSDPAAGGRAERPARPDRRRRLRQPVHFGGPCQTPTLDEARRRRASTYNRFHVTALCSPTRAALLSGPEPPRRRASARSPSSPAAGRATTRPGPKSAAGVAADPPGQRLLHRRVRQVAPDARQPAGPGRPVRPLAERPGASTTSGASSAASGPVRPGPDREQHHHRRARRRRTTTSPTDMADRTIDWLHGSEGPGARQAVLHLLRHRRQPRAAPRARRSGPTSTRASSTRAGTSSARRRSPGRRQLGVIPPTPSSRPRPGVPGLGLAAGRDQKTLYARQMEVYAGFQENADYEVGRVVDAIEEMGELDNTLIIYIWGDNGASMEGTETGTFNEMTTHQRHPADRRSSSSQLIESYGGIDGWGGRVMAAALRRAWAWAGNTPFQWGKQVASHLGGTRDPMVVSLARADQGPGRAARAVHPLHRHRPDDPRGGGHRRADAGRRHRADADARHELRLHASTTPSAEERHTQQYFEIFGNRAMYKDGWWLLAACCRGSRGSSTRRR